MLAWTLLILVFMVPVASHLQAINSGFLQTSGTIDSLLNRAIPQLVVGVKNLTFPRTPDCIKVVANYSKPTSRTVRFFLYNNRSNPNEAKELITHDLWGLKKSGFNSAWGVTLLFHGWLEPYDTPCIFPRTTKDLYFKLGTKRNIIMVDYSGITGYQTYFLATTVGLLECRDQGTDFIRWLHESKLVDLSLVHMIGASLGAQCAAIMAASVKAVLKTALGRLTGLDPAGPAFYPNLCSPHVICKEDANYVDIYHTNSQIFGLGIDKSCGHVDFYINGGMTQRFCLNTPCDHFSVLYIWEQSMRNSSMRYTCRNETKSPNPFRNCYDEKVAFGDSNNSTYGEYYVPFTFEEIYPAFCDSLEKCLSNPLSLYKKQRPWVIL